MQFFIIKKLNGQSQVAMSDSGLGSTRLFLYDKMINQRYLIDTGADISVLPPTSTDRKNIPSVFNLIAANNTNIQTYGQLNITVSLGLRRLFPWTFIIADVAKSIIVADFLSHNGLLIDLNGRVPIDRLTCVRSIGKVVIDPTPTITTLKTDNLFHQLIHSYSDLLENSSSSKMVTKHSVVHHIESKRTPVFVRSRKLPPLKLQQAKEEFEVVLQK